MGIADSGSSVGFALSNLIQDFEKSKQIENDPELGNVQNIVQKVTELTEKVEHSDLSCSDDVIVYQTEQEDYRIFYGVTVNGGANGSGLWSKYLSELCRLTSMMEAEFSDVWIIDFVTDPTDDVFSVQFGIVL